MRRLTLAWTLILLAAAALVPGGASAAPAVAASDTLRAGLTSEGSSGPVVCQAGDTLAVEIRILEAGPDFNAYDAYLRFDPTVLEFLPPIFLRDQEGPLMLDACSQTFHLFYESPDGMTLEIHHSLLCAGVSVNGPGTVYRVRFRCRDVDAFTHLELLTSPGGMTRFFENGFFVEPVVVTPLFVQVGAGAAPVPRVPEPSFLQAAPNPCNPRTVFSFGLPQPCPVRLDVVDVAGRRVRGLLGAPLDAGDHAVAWDGRDDAGRVLGSGVYFGVLEAGGRTRTVPVTLLK